MKGFVQVYTGNGKGKTTAALGLALRAAGAGLSVFIGQFLKQGDYSEINALKRFDDLITLRQYGQGRFVRGEPSPEEIAAARAGLADLRTAMASRTYDLVVVEEGNVAVACGLITVAELLDLVAARPDSTELLITGRNAPPELIAKADLVTEMREIKHYYQRGITARVGIEK